MRQSKFTETQIVSILKEADAGRPVNELWRTYGIRLTEVEHENSRLKRMYADLSLEHAALKDVIAKKL